MMNKSQVHPDFSIAGWGSFIKSGVWKNPFEVQSDEYWMAECLFEAMKSFPNAAPNPSVGSVFVKDGQEIARGNTQAFGNLHAETHALIHADSTLLKGAKLYVSLEPCSHTGKQPPCVDKIIDLGISQVNIALKDPNPLVGGNGIQKLLSAGIDVKIGTLHNEAYLLNASFFHGLNDKKPAYFLKWAQTIDGALADINGKSQWISGPESRDFTHYLRGRYDAILVGAQTVIQDQPSLTTRHPFFSDKTNPIRIIYDPAGRILALKDEALLEKIIEKTFSPDTKTILITKNTNSSILDQIKKQNTLTIITHGSHFVEELDEILTSPEVNNYAGKRLSSVLVEGGPKLLSAFLALEKFLAIHCFIAPKLLGGPHKIYSSLNSPLDLAPCFHRLNHFSLGEDTLIEFFNEKMNFPQQP